MNRAEIYEKLTEVFRDVFEDEKIEIDDATSASDIENWDSLMHITLISEVETVFDIKFSMKEVVGMKNVGEMLDVIERESR